MVHNTQQTRKFDFPSPYLRHEPLDFNTSMEWVSTPSLNVFLFSLSGIVNLPKTCWNSFTFHPFNRKSSNFARTGKKSKTLINLEEQIYKHKKVYISHKSFSLAFRQLSFFLCINMVKSIHLRPKYRISTHGRHNWQNWTKGGEQQDWRWRRTNTKGS